MFADLENSDFTCEPTDAAAPDSGRLTTVTAALAFICAGKATVTLKSTKTGTRFTYRVTAAPDGGAYFVALLNGPDNDGDYAYLGRIAGDGRFWQGRKVPRAGDIGPEAPSSKAFAWAWRALVNHTLPESLEIWHEGRCGRCARKLTVPESIASGFGPECIGKV